MLKTISDTEGRFEFESVKRGTPWLELFYTREELMAQRYWNLRKKSDEELSNLVLIASRPATLEVRVDRSEYPKATQILFQASNSYEGPNALMMAFTSQTVSLVEKQRDRVTFKLLPPGRYTVTLNPRSIVKKEIDIKEGDTSFIEF